eukprot:scaffold420_cov404-Prasinococcus_capsulatus_cf.AAC.22
MTPCRCAYEEMDGTFTPCVQPPRLVCPLVQLGHEKGVFFARDPMHVVCSHTLQVSHSIISSPVRHQHCVRSFEQRVQRPYQRLPLPGVSRESGGLFAAYRRHS